MAQQISSVLLAFFLLGLSAAYGQGLSQLETMIPEEIAKHGIPDLVLFNGKIVSLDDSGNNDNVGQTYSAMAVKGDAIIALGSNEKIQGLMGSTTLGYDLKGKTVIPGIIDTHSHIYRVERFAHELGITLPFQIAIPEATTVGDTRQNIARALANAMEKVQPGEWIVAGMTANPETGSRKAVYWAREKTLANKEFLDGVTKRRNPVMLRAGTRAFLNTPGLHLANEAMPGFSEFIDETMGPEASDYGWLGSQEQGAVRWNIFLADEPLEVLAEGIRRNLEMAAAAGWTTFSTRIPLPTIMSAFVLLDRTGQMPIRLGGHFETHRQAAPPGLARAFYDQTGALWGLGSDYFWLTGVASERWDSLGPEACLGPDIEAPEEVRIAERCPEPGSIFWDVLKSATLAGWRPAGVHGVGSHGVRLFIQLLEEVMEEKGWTAEDIRKLRPTVEHGMVLGTKPDVLAKLKEYGIIVSIGPVFIGQGRELMEERYGPALEEFVLPARSLMDAGIKVVGQLESSYSVGYYLWTLITRKAGDRVINAKEAIDRVRALKMWTRWAADYVLREGDLGSLEVGKKADFVVLDRDYFSIQVDDIPAIRPLMTVVGGKTRYLQREFARELQLQPVGYQTEDPRPWDLDPRQRRFTMGSIDF